MISPVCIPQKHPEEASEDAAQARGERVGAGQDGDTRKSKSAGLTKAQRPQPRLESARASSLVASLPG